jgi:RND family efflux transporter MFP subunit
MSVSSPVLQYRRRFLWLLCAGLLSITGQVLAADNAEDFECVVMPNRVLDLSSGVSGRLQRVLVERAERVSAGQPLADLESQVEQANLALARARANMNSEVQLRASGLDFDERRLARIDNLQAKKVVSVQDQDEAARAAKLGQWQLAVAKDNLRLAKLDTGRAEAALALRRVVSPFDGVVVERFKSPGEFVDKEAILRVAQLDPLRIEVIVPIARYSEFNVGQSVTVFPETNPQAPWQAPVIAVDAVGDPASGTFRARLEYPNPGQRHLAGIKCMARLENTAPSKTMPASDAAPLAQVSP